MFGFDEDCIVTAREIGNIRFLIEQQLQIIDGLDRRGLDQRAARDLLARLLRRDEELRQRQALQGQSRTLSFA